MAQPVNTIRESNRIILNINRRRLRDEEKDVRRSLSNLCISSENVKEIVNKLKTKSTVTVEELNSLKNALNDEERNLQMVLSTHGAVRGLVRELTGHNERKQYEAAGCCCNLALGDHRACVAIAKAAGPYLIALLNNLTTELAAICTWTLGNLAGSGLKAAEMLVSQGVIGKLTDQLNVNNVKLTDAALEALTQFTYQLKDDLSSEHFHGILSKLQEIPITTSSLNLLFILSCHKLFTLDCVKIFYIEKILEDFYTNVKNYTENIQNLIYLLRILANFNNKDLYCSVLDYFANNNIFNVNKLLNNNKLSENILWFLGNMFNLCPNHEFFVH